MWMFFLVPMQKIDLAKTAFRNFATHRGLGGRIYIRPLVQSESGKKDRNATRKDELKVFGAPDRVREERQLVQRVKKETTFDYVNLGYLALFCGGGIFLRVLG